MRVRCKAPCLPTLDLLPVLLRLHKLARREEVVKEDRDADLEEDPVDKHLPCAARRASESYSIAGHKLRLSG